MCSGSSTSATKASVNAPGNQQHHPSYDNAACAGSVISTACHPPSRFEESLTSILPSMVGRDQEAVPKPDGRTQSNTTSILLASTPSMPPSWSMTDPSGRPLFEHCQRSNPSMALKSSKSHIPPAPLHPQQVTRSRCPRAPSSILTYLLPSNPARFRLDHSGSYCNCALQAYVYLDVVPSHPTSAYQFPPIPSNALPPSLYRCRYLLTNFVLLSPSPSGYLQSRCCLVSSHVRTSPPFLIVLPLDPLFLRFPLPIPVP